MAAMVVITLIVINDELEFFEMFVLSDAKPVEV